MAAARDERAAATDRAAAAADRDAAERDREAAHDRVRAAADREQAALERAQHGQGPSSDSILGQSHRRVQAVLGLAQETARTAADLVQEFIQAKQREMAAHLASIQVHEQMAELQKQLGHPARAAKARAKAGRAREFHRVAAAELAGYLARIKAVKDSWASYRQDGIGRTGE